MALFIIACLSEILVHIAGTIIGSRATGGIGKDVILGYVIGTGIVTGVSIAKKVENHYILPARIGKHNGNVVAVSEKIVALQAAVGTEDDIGRQEPADIGVIVSGVQVVPASLYVVVVPSVSERVHGSDGGG